MVARSLGAGALEPETPLGPCSVCVCVGGGRGVVCFGGVTPIQYNS